MAFNCDKFTASFALVPFATLVTLLPPISTVLPFVMVKLPSLVSPVTFKLLLTLTFVKSTFSLVEMLSVSPAPSILMFLPALMFSVSPALILEFSFAVYVPSPPSNTVELTFQLTLLMAFTRVVAFT